MDEKFLDEDRVRDSAYAVGRSEVCFWCVCRLVLIQALTPNCVETRFLSGQRYSCCCALEGVTEWIQDNEYEDAQ
jgi:hypothetical protein